MTSTVRHRHWAKKGLLPENWYDLELNRRLNFLNGGEFDGQKLVGTMKRDKVCNMEIWTECFGNTSSKIGRADSNQIIAMLERIPGWVRAQSGQFLRNPLLSIKCMKV